MSNLNKDYSIIENSVEAFSACSCGICNCVPACSGSSAAQVQAGYSLQAVDQRRYCP